MTTAHGTHDHADDPRNAQILINVNGRLVPRAQAVVSVFDAGFVLGDGVWEGLRVSAGHPAFLEQHLDRLWEGAAAIALDIGRGRSRANVLRVCSRAGIPARERSFSLIEVYSADEAFVTGTFAGLVPVHTVDGRRIGDGRRGPMVERLQNLYRALVREDVAGRRAR